MWTQEVKTVSICGWNYCFQYGLQHRGMFTRNKSPRLTVLCKQSGALFSSMHCFLHHLIWFDCSRDKQEMQFKISCLSSWLKEGKFPLGQMQIARLDCASLFCKWGNSVWKTLIYESPVVRPFYLCNFSQHSAPLCYPGLQNYLSLISESACVVPGKCDQESLRFLTLCSIPPSRYIWDLYAAGVACERSAWLLLLFSP